MVLVVLLLLVSHLVLHPTCAVFLICGVYILKYFRFLSWSRFHFLKLQCLLIEMFHYHHHHHHCRLQRDCLFLLSYYIRTNFVCLKCAKRKLKVSYSRHVSSSCLTNKTSHITCWHGYGLSALNFTCLASYSFHRKVMLDSCIFHFVGFHSRIKLPWRTLLYQSRIVRRDGVSVSATSSSCRSERCVSNSDLLANKMCRQWVFELQCSRHQHCNWRYHAIISFSLHLTTV
jgi:hypothetical protein